MEASPLRREKNVDICALNDSKFIIQAKSGLFAEVRSLNADLSEQAIRSLHKLCWNGDHYMARTYLDTSGSTKSNRDPPPPLKTRFYIIKDKSCIEVDDLAGGFGCTTYSLHPKCQDGSFYLVNRTGFVIIRSKASTFERTWSLETSPDLPQSLHDTFRDGLYYFSTDDFIYVVKNHPLFGLVYHRARSLSSASEKDIVPISESVAGFIRNQLHPALPTKGMFSYRRLVAILYIYLLASLLRF